MARRPRLFIPEMPYHVVQRGHNRQLCFFQPQDRAVYMQLLAESLLLYAVKLHAFVLMSNHVHLLLTPSDSSGISKVIQALGRDYVHYINQHYQRRGTLWEGRFKAGLVDTSRYVLLCQRYIELNPVRAGMVKHPAQYHWSSYASHAEGMNIRLLTPHPTYLAMADTTESRQQAYRRLLECEMSEQELLDARQILRKGGQKGVRALNNSITLCSDPNVYFMLTDNN